MKTITERRRAPGGEHIIAVRALDMPAGPEPGPEPTAPPAAAPDAPPDPPGLEPAPYGYRADLAAPPAASAEAIALLAAARGPVALAEALGAVAALDAELAARGPRLAGPDARAALASILDVLARRGAYAGRARDLAAALGLEPPAIPAAAEVPSLARVWASMPAGSDAGRELAGRVDRLRSELAAVDRELANVREWAARDEVYHELGFTVAVRSDATGCAGGLSGTRYRREEAHGPDAWLCRAAEVLARRGELARSLASAEADRDAAVGVVSAAVAAAVDAAGGRDEAIDLAVRAQALAAAVPGPPPELTAVDEQLARLRDAGGDTGELEARRKAILDGLAADRQSRRERRRAVAEGLVDGAVGGDEPSRGALEAVLAAAPDVAPGLHRAIAASRFDRAYPAALAAIL